MSTLLVTHEDGLNHVTPDGHPERVARLEHLWPALEGKDVVRAEAPLAEDADLTLCHPQDYVDMIREAIPAQGFNQLDGDTWLSPGSYNCASRAVGGAMLAVDKVMAGEVGNAFVAMRPPGHHAETATPMGFCLFGTVAIAAKHALERHGLSRVAVVDFDVHHGNGTQAAFADDPDLFYASTHQWPLYPGTGRPDERGCNGNILNAVLPPGAGSERFRAAMRDQVLPALDSFAPELVMISAGFDGHVGDPLAELELEDADYGWATSELCALARRHSGGRLVSVLEGGYSLAALESAAREHVAALLHAPAAG